MRLGVIESVIEGGGRIVVRFPDETTREYGLSRGRRSLERPKVGMALAHMASGQLRFFASVDEAYRLIAQESPE